MRLGINIRRAGGWGSVWRDDSDNSAHRFAADNIQIELTKRLSYPETFAFLNGQHLVFGYAGPKAAKLIHRAAAVNWSRLMNYLDDEFLVVECNLAAGTLRLQRDATTTLPLFWADTPGQQAISSSFSGIFERLEPTSLNLDYRNLTELIYLFDINQNTLFKEIKLLTERSRLEINAEDSQLILPSDSPLPVVDKAAPRHFKRVLEEVLDNYAAKAPDHLAFELSGGIDSATAPGYMADTKGLKPLTASMLFPGELRVTQQEKIVKFQERFGGKNLAFTIKSANHPFARFNNRLPKLPPYQFQEIYTEVLDRTAKLILEAGADTIFTGMGGDELFENVDFDQESHEGKAEISRRRQAPPPAIYQPALKNLLDSTLKDMEPKRTTPIPLAGRSALFGGYSRNNVYLELGLWPLSPLADWRLFQFCQSLPIKFRANKNILRAYQQARRFPEEIYAPKVNENFGHYFDESITIRFRPLLETVLQTSFLSGLGLVEKAVVLKHYDGLKSGRTPAAPMNFFTFVTAEIILQSARKLGHRIKT